MHNLDENSITGAVLQRMSDAADPRFKQIMDSLVRHLHDFAREVELTEAEWFTGIRFLTEVGRICDDKRQEFILLSDTLGLSMLVTAQNHRKPAGCTEATVFGPFHVDQAPQHELGADIGAGAKGEPCYVSGRVVDDSGAAVPGAKMDVWQADADGFYDVQYEGLAQHRARGVIHADNEGRFHFKSVLAEPYPIPADGPVGRMLEAMKRHPWRPSHLHFMIEAEGCETLVTHVFREGCRYLESDAVFGVRSSLIAPWIRHEPGATPDDGHSAVPFYTLEFDFVLARKALLTRAA